MLLLLLFCVHFGVAVVLLLLLILLLLQFVLFFVLSVVGMNFVFLGFVLLMLLCFVKGLYSSCCCFFSWILTPMLRCFCCAVGCFFVVLGSAFCALCCCKCCCFCFFFDPRCRNKNIFVGF